MQAAPKKKSYTQRELDELHAQAYHSNREYDNLVHKRKLGIAAWTDVEAPKLFAPLVKHNEKMLEYKEKAAGSKADIQRKIDDIKAQLSDPNFIGNREELLALLEEFTNRIENKIPRVSPYQQLVLRPD